MISDDKVKIGDRVECGEHYGTVKYIGEVDGYPGTWYGIDWDDPNRGKHNGKVRDKQYFVAIHPKSASFVRPEKVTLGQTVLSAIQSRYGQRNDVNDDLDKQRLRYVQQVMNAPFLEMVGFDKITDIQRDLNKLKIVNIRLQCVNNPGKPHELENACPNIVELDISKNLLTKWTEIFEVCVQLKNLTWLNVSENIIHFPDNYNEYKFENLKVVICGSMNLTWMDLKKISVIFPNIEELRVPKNNITSLDTPENHSFQNLALLDLEDNKVGSWNEIMKLGVINTLEQLILENTEIKAIRFPQNYDRTKMFINLKKLTLTNNNISDWKSIGELNNLKNLQELRLLRNPILETEKYSTCIQFVIARIASLQFINGTSIKPEERKGAEYDYLKKFTKEWFSVRSDENKSKDFLDTHSRFLELVDKYGLPEESELKQETKNISGSLIRLKIVYDNQEKLKLLPPTVQVQKLAIITQKLFNLTERPVLVCIPENNTAMIIELDDDTKEIGYYSIQSGDKIVATI